MPLPLSWLFNNPILGCLQLQRRIHPCFQRHAGHVVCAFSVAPAAIMAALALRDKFRFAC